MRALESPLSWACQLSIARSIGLLATGDGSRRPLSRHHSPLDDDVVDGDDVALDLVRIEYWCTGCGGIS